MRSIVVSVLGVLLAASQVGAQAPPTSLPDVEREIRQAIRERLDAYARGDAPGWARFVAEDCLCGTATKAELQHEIVARSPGLKNGYGEIVGLEVRLYGDVAVIRYRTTEYSEASGQRITVRQRRTETHLRRGGRWILVGLAESVMPEDPVVARIDPKLYDAYVGQYEYAPGMVDTVTREGDHLMVQAVGQAKEEVFPENETTYFGKGQDWRMIFVKDEQGRVTSVRFRQNGQDLIGRRVREERKP